MFGLTSTVRVDFLEFETAHRWFGTVSIYESPELL